MQGLDVGVKRLKICARRAVVSSEVWLATVPHRFGSQGLDLLGVGNIP